MVNSLQPFSTTMSAAYGSAHDLTNATSMKPLIEQNVRVKALVNHSQGRPARELREAADVAIGDAVASIQKYFPEIGKTSPMSDCSEPLLRKPAENCEALALPAEIWTEIAKKLRAADRPSVKNLRLVNKQLKDIAERDVKRLVVKNSDALHSLVKTDSYRNTEKFVLIGNRGEFRNIPSKFEGKLHYVERRRRDELDLLGRRRPELAWNHFDRMKRETEGTTFSLLDAAEAAGIEVVSPPERNKLSVWLRSLFEDLAREKMEHFLKQGFTAEEAAKITRVKNEKLISELGGTSLTLYPAQRARAEAHELSFVKEVVKQFQVMAAMEWLNEQEQQAEQGQRS